VALGADYQKGRQSDGAMQGTTLVFRLGNVKADPLDFLPDVSKDEYHYDEAAREAYEKGEISFPLEGVGCMSLVPGMEGWYMFSVRTGRGFWQVAERERPAIRE
jgi:hypothetical protein